MKKIIKNLMYTGLFSMVLIFNSCLKEASIEGIDEQPITAGSTIASLIKNTATKDGSFDNIVDGASCLAIKFPYTVEVAGTQVVIDSKEDFQLIEDIFDEFDNDDDILEILFPITITLGDFTEITIENKNALGELIAECTEGEDDDIECIDFVYPITLFTFDINDQKTGEVVVNSDKELKRFFIGLEDNDLVSIDFPITLKKFDGTEIMVYSHTELAIALEIAKNACDEDDDNDYNDDDFSKERLDAYLTECPWVVREVKRDGTDQTDQYFEYLMYFNEDSIVTVKDATGTGAILHAGTWKTSASDRGAVLDLEFETLVDFNLQWLVYEIGEGKIKFFGDDNNKIILKQFCEGGSNPDALAQKLKECEWIVAKAYFGTPEDDRFFLHGFTMDFKEEKKWSISNGIEIYDQGFWEVGVNVKDELFLIFYSEDESEDESTEFFKWTLVNFSESRLTFKIEELGYELILEKTCEDDVLDEDETEISNYISEGLWSVSSYIENNEDLTHLIISKFEFKNGNNLVLGKFTDFNIEVIGTWRVKRNSLGNLRFFLVLDEDSEVSDLSNNWQILEATPNQIKLGYEDEDFEIFLVFEKE